MIRVQAGKQMVFGKAGRENRLSGKACPKRQIVV